MVYNKKVLPNGLRLLTIPMPSFESATVLVMVKAGSRYETVKNSGISHFLEHMAFKGTQRRPDAMAISSLIDGIGGEFNAFTGKEYTGYYIKSAKTHIGTSLDVLSDMLMNSKLDPTEIEKEKGVILEEINLYEDTPSRKIGDIYEHLLYGDTPMGWDIAGDKEIIKAITREDFVSYMGSLYSAANMTVVVAGGIDPSDTSGQAEEYFGKMPKFETAPYLPVVELQKKPEVEIREKKTEQIHIAVGVRTNGLDGSDRYPLSVLAAILGGGMSSRLFHEVREKRGLGYYVRSHSEHYEDVGSLSTTAGVDPKRVIEAVEVIMAEYAKVAQGKMKIADDELKKAKEYMKGHLVLELEDSRSVSVYYAHQELLEKEKLNPDEIIKRIDAVTMDEVEEAGKRHFKNEGLNLALIGNFDNRQALENVLQL